MSAGISPHETEGACLELLNNDLVLSDGENWSAFDLAWLYLRLTAPDVPLDIFRWQIANSTLSGCVIDDYYLDDPATLASFDYTKPLFRHSMITLLEEQFSDLSGSDKYEIDCIAVHSNKDGYSVSLTVLLPATGDAPDSAVYLFGDPHVYCTGGRATCLPAETLYQLEAEMQQARNQPADGSIVRGMHSSFMASGSTLIH